MTPCTCKVTVRRDPRTLMSTPSRTPSVDCPQHGVPKPQPPKEKP